MKALCIALAALVALSTLSACNTVQGLGKDIQRAGEKIEDVTKKK